MAEYLAPGVYVEEVDRLKSIEGVGTSTAGFIGQAERGPCEPTFITGFEQYRSLFGGFDFKVQGDDAPGYLPFSIKGFFENGGRRAFVCRVASKDSKYASFDVAGQDDKAAPVPLPTPEPSGGTEESKKGSITKSSPSISPLSKGSSVAYRIIANGPGAWGNDIRVQIEPSDLFEANHPIKGKLFSCKITYFPDNQKPGAKPSFMEVYKNVSTDPKSPDYFGNRITNHSCLVNVEKVSDLNPKPFKEASLQGGHDGNELVLGDYEGESKGQPRKRTGLLAMADIPDISLVICPDEHEVVGLTGALVGHCERLRYRFLISQSSLNAESPGTLRASSDSKYAAFYYPWIKVVHPLTGEVRCIHGGGHIAGVYAKTDVERGCWKAPANTKILGAVDTELIVNHGEQEMLNPRGVNCIRTFPGRGILVWGARCTTSDPEWKYVPVRRLFIFVEQSIERGTQWVVFEPNSERLWARVRQSVIGFLRTQWRAGALMGTSEEQAFFVKCDRTTMTQDDLDNGRLIVIVGIAAVKPAEFVIFRISQFTAGAES
ncbi:MAG: hypothetical protein NPIRA04_04750 [Nitrospirales bacterium]|nr:MAG: hypothetical protein NPIRA04_04750 [Nitrospirales bacterium]